MRTSEMAAAVGEKSYTIRDLIKAGKIVANIVPDNTNAKGVAYEISSSVDEVRAALNGRIRRQRKISTPAAKRAASRPLPANKDLFIPEEIARLTGVSKSTVYNFIKEKGITPLRNGRNQYVPRAVVEQIREKYARPEPVSQVVVAPQVIQKADPRIDRIEKNLNTLAEFLVRFAKSCGYSEE